MAMMSARPKTKPVRTEAEKNCAIRPSRSTPASSEMSPAIKARVAVRTTKRGEPACASAPTVAADSTATAADTATMSWRELPKSA